MAFFKHHEPNLKSKKVHAASRAPMATPQTFSLRSVDGVCWLKHKPTSTWFECTELVGKTAIGLDTWNGVVAVPLSECQHSYDRDLDS